MDAWQIIGWGIVVGLALAVSFWVVAFIVEGARMQNTIRRAHEVFICGVQEWIGDDGALVTTDVCMVLPPGGLGPPERLLRVDRRLGGIHTTEWMSEKMFRWRFIDWRLEPR